MRLQSGGSGEIFAWHDEMLGAINYLQSGSTLEENVAGGPTSLDLSGFDDKDTILDVFIAVLDSRCLQKQRSGKR
jgi:hypothetical protein